MLLSRPPNVEDGYMERLQQCDKAECKQIIFNYIVHRSLDSGVQTLALYTSIVLCDIRDCHDLGGGLVSNSTVERMKLALSYPKAPICRHFSINHPAISNLYVPEIRSLGDCDSDRHVRVELQTKGTVSEKILGRTFPGCSCRVFSREGARPKLGLNARHYSDLRRSVNATIDIHCELGIMNDNLDTSWQGHAVTQSQANYILQSWRDYMAFIEPKTKEVKEQSCCKAL